MTAMSDFDKLKNIKVDPIDDELPINDKEKRKTKFNLLKGIFTTDLSKYGIK